MPVFPEGLHQQGEEPGLALFHAEGEGLNHQHIPKAVHRESRQRIRLAKDCPAAGQLFGAQHALPVGPGVAEPAQPEGVVKDVVGVAGEEPHPDEGAKAQKPRAQPVSLFSQHVHDAAVFRAGGAGENLALVDPGVAAFQGALALLGDGDNGVVPLLLHLCLTPWCSCRSSPGCGRWGFLCRRNRRSGRTGNR